MKREIYVVSDLHLGGAPGADGGPGFQMCPPENQARLAGFVEGLPAPDADRDVRLVLAGDIVDFLAEKEFAAFTDAEESAVEKLGTIMERTDVFWSALAGFVKKGGELTLLLGNHDLELSLPAVRRALMGRLGRGRVEFIYDNEALSIGPVLIEHGNRCDGWNAVPHGALRRVRSQLSRKIEAKPPFPALPGSRLVVDVMNAIKSQYSFVDLLKPEDTGVLPILAALGAGDLSDAWNVCKQFRRKYAVDFEEEEGEPEDETYIAAIPDHEEDLYSLAQDLAAGGDATQVSGRDLTGLREEVGEKVREARREMLRKAFRSDAFRHEHKRAFRRSHEKGEYLKRVKAALARGFEVVIYGHTHLAKRIRFKDGGTYLNTGTWADLIRVPEGVWSEDADEAGRVLDGFVRDLEADQVAAWRRSVGTYAKVALDGETVVESNVLFADDHTPISNAGIDARLA